jgi:hypothetical protein
VSDFIVLGPCAWKKFIFLIALIFKNIFDHSFKGALLACYLLLLAAAYLLLLTCCSPAAQLLLPYCLPVVAAPCCSLLLLLLLPLVQTFCRNRK